MNPVRTLASALAGFVVFAPATFLWHTVLFSSAYIGPGYSVKTAESLSPPFLAAAIALLMLGMGAILPKLVGPSNRVRSGALAGALFVSLVVDFHSLFLNGLFPGQDPASLYLLDAGWAAIFGAVAGAIVVAVNDRLAGPSLSQRPLSAS